MDRLQAVAVALVLIAGCEDSASKTKNAAASGRVNAGQAARPEKKETAAEFCDVYETGDKAPAFAFPSLDADPPPAAKTWRWINVWATWCKPCVEELPMIQKWQRRLAKDGRPIELILLSTDESREVIDTFRGEHKSIPETLRAADPDSVGPWVATLGLDAGAPLPIHMFVAPNGAVRCLRAGAVNDKNYDAIASLLSPATR